MPRLAAFGDNPCVKALRATLCPTPSSNDEQATVMASMYHPTSATDGIAVSGRRVCGGRRLHAIRRLGRLEAGDVADLLKKKDSNTPARLSTHPSYAVLC